MCIDLRQHQQPSNRQHPRTMDDFQFNKDRVMQITLDEIESGAHHHQAAIRCTNAIKHNFFFQE